MWDLLGFFLSTLKSNSIKKQVGDAEDAQKKESQRMKQEPV